VLQMENYSAGSSVACLPDAPLLSRAILGGFRFCSKRFCSNRHILLLPIVRLVLELSKSLGLLYICTVCDYFNIKKLKILKQVLVEQNTLIRANFSNKQRICKCIVHSPSSTFLILPTLYVVSRPPQGFGCQVDWQPQRTNN
jgi:hypothetical protein